MAAGSSGSSSSVIKWLSEEPDDPISESVTYCVRKFLEIEHGHREEWADETKLFCATCFNKIDTRMEKERLGRKGCRL